jgi:hypothetical protein
MYMGGTNSNTNKAVSHLCRLMNVVVTTSSEGYRDKMNVEFCFVVFSAVKTTHSVDLVVCCFFVGGDLPYLLRAT